MAEQENIQNQEVEQTTTQEDAADIQTVDKEVDADVKALQDNIITLKTTLENMQENSAELLSDEIASIKQKIEDAEAELAAKTTAAVEETETKISSWWDEHKSDIFNGAKIAVLVYIAYRLTA